MTSFTARVRAIYSASIEERTTVGCHFKYELTGPPLSMKMKLEVDFQISLPLA